MLIEPGRTLLLSDQHGTGVAYTVRAVRHFPIDFVELEPCDGGPIQTMPMSKIDKTVQPG